MTMLTALIWTVLVYMEIRDRNDAFVPSVVETARRSIFIACAVGLAVGQVKLWVEQHVTDWIAVYMFTSILFVFFPLWIRKELRRQNNG